jgi:hypothetical protein
LADGVELLLGDKLDQLGISLAAGHFHLKPGRFAPVSSPARRVGGKDQMIEGNAHAKRILGFGNRRSKLRQSGER